MKYVASIRGGGQNDFARKIRGHEKFLLFIKISSGPLPSINNDLSLSG
jgi:hypothetical protein